MKKLKSLEKIILILTVIAVICGISSINYATGDLNDILKDPDSIPIKPEEGETKQETQTPSTNPNTSLPKTGANDTGIWVLAGACAVIAVYTYKKVRDYNV